MIISHNGPHESTTCIVFICGFMKGVETWNVTEKGKKICIEEHFSGKYKTMMVSMQEREYLNNSFDAVCTELLGNLNLSGYKNICVVAHSYGAFYAVRIAGVYPKCKLLLLDPTLKGDVFKRYLILKKDAMSVHKLSIYDQLPSLTALTQKTVVYIHYCINDKGTSSDILGDIITSAKSCNKNVNSNAFVHYDWSHMIHYQHPQRVIGDIEKLLKC